MSAPNGLPEDRKLGRYEIVAELGKGAMGTVYKANDPLLERTVALKTISLAVSENELAEYEARFYQEAKAAGGLNHPNIVTIHDVGKTDGVPYLAMEYLEGSELHRVLRHSKPLASAHALEIAAQVAEGLAYAHERGVVHRDVKPANIMVVRGGLVKIADFGVARMRSSERGPDTHVVGSPRYMSPEQVLRKRADHRSDIFSLGVVLYEMLTGAPPFTGADLNAILHQIVNAEPAPVTTTVPGLPDMVDSILRKMLAKAPEDRYQTARELVAELRECRKQMPATTTLAQLALPEKAPPKDPAATAAAPPSGAASASGAPQPAEEKEIGAATDEHARTLGLSKDFDSLSATARLAAETGVLGAFASFINTASGSASTATVVAEPAAPNPAMTSPGAGGSGIGTPASSAASKDASPAPAPDPGIAEAWSPKHRLVFGGSVAVALVIAAVIVFV